MNLNPNEIANAVATIITCDAKPWKIILGLFTFAYSIAQDNHVQLSGEICGRSIAYSSEPVRLVEQNPGVLPPAPEQAVPCGA